MERVANDKYDLFGVFVSITLYQTLLLAFYTSFPLPEMKVMDLI